MPIVSLRVSDDVAARLDAKAATEDLDRSGYLRKLIVDDVGETPPPKKTGVYARPGLPPLKPIPRVVP